MIKYIEDKDTKEKICRNILKQLPEWFGQESGVSQYAKESRDSNLWAYFDNDKPVGFIVMKETSPYTVEISVMGVLKSRQRKGIGVE